MDLVSDPCPARPMLPLRGQHDVQADEDVQHRSRVPLPWAGSRTVASICTRSTWTATSPATACPSWSSTICPPWPWPSDLGCRRRGVTGSMTPVSCSPSPSNRQQRERNAPLRDQRLAAAGDRRHDEGSRRVDQPCRGEERLAAAERVAPART